jgi:predicted transcriptional regulator
MGWHDRHKHDAAPHFIAAFWHETRAATTIEQALFIALVIGASLATIEGLGIVSHSTFFTVAHEIGGSAPPTSASSNSSADDRAPTRSLAAPAAGYNELALSSRLLWLLIVCPLGAACWYFLYRDSRRRRSPVAGEEPAAQPTEHPSLFEKRHELLRTFSGDLGIFFTSRMRIRQVMTRDVQCVLPSASVAQLRAVMEQRRIRHLIVCDQQRRMLGIVNERNLLATTARTAGELMTRDPVFVEPDCLVNPAVTLMLQQRLSCLPVVEAEQVVGVVTTTDLLMALQCTLHALQRAGAEAVADLPPETVPGFMLAALQQCEQARPAESLQSAVSQ